MIQYLGWSFEVIPRSFLVHFPHRQSGAWRQWREARDGETRGNTLDKMRMNTLYEDFLAELLAGGAGAEIAVRLCAGADSAGANAI